MSEELFEVLGVSVTVTGVYGFVSFLVLILFMALWARGRKKRTGQPIFAGQVVNGTGFGLLPALAVLKAFQESGAGNGSKVTEPLPLIRWLSVDGFYRPTRIEAAAAVVFFLCLCLWLIMKKQELPDNGDLLMITVCLWAAIRLETENFRAEPHSLFRYTSCITIFFCMLVWGIRLTKVTGSPVRLILNLLAVGGCLTLNLLTGEGVLSAGSEIGDFAVKTGSDFLAMLLTLIAGGDLRRIMKKAQAQPG